MSEEKHKAFITKDQELLKQYYDLRHNSYRDDNGWKDYDGSESKFDREGEIAVVVKDGKVIGGARLMFSDRSQFLSNEIPGTQYDYKKFIRKYDNRENLLIGEVSSVVVEKSHRDSSATAAVFSCLLEKSKSQGCDYIFAVAVAVVCRSQRKILRRVGCDVEIIINFPWREKKVYNFAKMFPMYAKL